MPPILTLMSLRTLTIVLGHPLPVSWNWYSRTTSLERFYKMDWPQLLNDTRIRVLLNGDPSDKKPGELRTEFERDYGRTVFSTPVRRLQDKAQVFPLVTDDFVRTRLTHSIEVSSVARGLAGAWVGRWLVEKNAITEKMRADLETIAATSAMLHDLGNPPFGHAGEDAISEWCSTKLCGTPRVLGEEPHAYARPAGIPVYPEHRRGATSIPSWVYFITRGYPGVGGLSSKEEISISPAPSRGTRVTAQGSRNAVHGARVTQHGSRYATHYSLSTTRLRPLETPTPNGASLYMYTQERPGGPGTQVLDMRRFLIAIASLAVLPAIASAQRGGMGGGMARPGTAASAPHGAMHAAPSVGTHATSQVTSQVNSGTHSVWGTRYVRTRSGAIVARPIPHSTAPVQRAGSGRQLLSRDMVPGLGFDYAHVAAVHPNGIHNRFRNRQFVGTFIPFFYGGGYSMPFSSDEYADDAPAAESQQADAAQQDASQTVYSERPARPSRDYVPAPQTASEREAEQYVFVRRDGTVFFASAYAWENGTLRYITTEGLRHTVTADKLDLDATQQFNEQRGLTFRSPV
jgi:hypothetical protein